MIAISGKYQSGKDTVASMLQYLSDPTAHRPWSPYASYRKSPWQNMKLGYPIKQIASILTGIQPYRMETAQDKEVILDPEWNLQFPGILNYFGESSGMSLRWLLQRIGDAMLTIHPDWLINVLFRDYKPSPIFIEHIDSQGVTHVKANIEAKYPKWIISDMRKPNEYDKVKSFGGHCIRVIKTNHVSDNHISETALDHITQWDYVMEASHGDYDNLMNQVKAFYHEICNNI